jgi:hypothetical protein
MGVLMISVHFNARAALKKCSGQHRGCLPEKIGFHEQAIEPSYVFNNSQNNIKFF